MGAFLTTVLSFMVSPAGSAIVGGILVIVTGAFVPSLVKRLEVALHKQALDHERERRRIWGLAETDGPREPERGRAAGGELLGLLECVMFYGSFLMGGAGIALISAWLIFKTAAKWKTWDASSGITQTEVWVRYRIFLVGTAANVVAALIGVAVVAMLRSSIAVAP